jgi:hypothetical protein
MTLKQAFWNTISLTTAVGVCLRKFIIDSLKRSCRLLPKQNGGMMKLILSVLSVLIFVGCGGSGGSSGEGDNPRKPVNEYVNWEAVPSQYSKEIEMVGFASNIPEIFETNIFGFQKDVRLIYVSDLPADSARVKIYWVWKGSVGFGTSNPRVSGNRLKLSKTGFYSCSISVENRVVKSVEGGCIVRVEIELPKDQKTEVYNAGERISKLFFPMTVENFLELLDDATWADEKKDIVNSFKHSYVQTGHTLKLSCAELRIAIGEFIRGDDKLWLLRNLHNFISDRENLERMIDDEFYGFDREDAKKIVGIK